uniref:Possible beta-xylosidase diverged, family 5/39 of glycosyl hydrolases and alpha-amylase C (Greek key) C-terminal domain n=1 Tax=Nonomuraea gerenzanensis TaxID=93944 RepID=A0A1M4EFM3_9ACTN|nr:Possible beta-xylosidase diverged, family 5/39 of glycosyl hydrolases and alpha-amylase C (Greek key) C-terminal domain [Nonomuraea gerenzanensis]
MTMTPARATTAPDVVTVNFAQRTGPVHGGATGMLYGLSDPGVPGDSLLAGARPRTVAQKAPDGDQHPNGDALKIADGFLAAGGEEIVVYMQDVYSRWPYENLGIDDYLAKVDTMVRKVVRERPRDKDRFVWVPFNEPDGIWYQDWGTLKEKFFSDWKAVFDRIRSIDPQARIVGPNEARYNPGRLRDFLTWAEANDRLPDIMAWHELSRGSLADYRGHYEHYRAMERELGIGPLPINIDEYGNRRDMSVPGQMIQWISMFEDTKVDADMAYWTYAGNLDDHAVRTRQANGGWWLLKWYADLTGQTVSATPPRPAVPDTVQAVAALDEPARRGTVLVGGGTAPVRLDLTGLDPALFGRQVDVVVSRTTWTGYEGDALKPPVVAARRTTVSGGRLGVDLPGGDVMAAYRVTIVPSSGPAPVPDAPWTTSVEAESATLTSAQVYDQDTTADPQRYATSGKRDVGSMNKPDSAVTFPVTVPRAGRYRLGVYHGANKTPGRHALFVDGRLDQVVQYSANLGWTYRGRTDVEVELTAGTHQLSLRTSTDGTSLLPGSDVTLDKFDLTEVTGPARAAYPADEARLSGGARLTRPATGPAITLGGGARATFFVAAAQDGYHDLTLSYRSSAAGDLDVRIDGRAVTGVRATRPGDGTSRVRAYLPAGISKVEVGGPAGLNLRELVTVRAAQADTAVHRVEAEQARLAGTARVVSATGGSNASAGAYVGDLGDGAGNTLTLTRPAGAGPGQYVLVTHYANADRNTGHPYNTDVISRFLDIAETGGGTTRGVFRHNYAWDNFWPQTTPLTLTTPSGSLVLGNASAFGPNVDRLELARFVLEVDNRA